MKKKIQYVILFIGIMLIVNIRVNAYDSYQIGDIINFKGEEYYVINNSDANSNYVTAFKVKSLIPDEIYRYGSNFNSGIVRYEGKVYEFEDGSGGIAYYSRYYYCSVEYIEYYNDFRGYRTDNCTNDYSVSDVKKSY